MTLFTLRRCRSLSVRHWAVALVLAVAAAIYLGWSDTDSIGDLGTDAPSYLLMARHYAGLRNEAADGSAAQSMAAVAGAISRYPPLYSLALSRWGMTGDLHRVHRFDILLLLFGLAGLYA